MGGRVTVGRGLIGLSVTLISMSGVIVETNI